MDLLTISDTEIDEALRITSDIIDECGLRLPGSDSVNKAAEILFVKISEFCDNAHKEEFTFVLHAFMGFFN
jgi:hypothetical protein